MLKALCGVSLPIWLISFEHNWDSVKVLGYHEREGMDATKS